ncbi:hypothetical protein [Alkalimarinus sediminis]|uniref:Uncharacterized protein n=1 Tax=Alkalimarinus sediminis TaxID=1632866 RepID=A0A9E8KQE0_9ALTE|nr:hypothetical protein [Alkalimarinus sediminis]UZW75095.1 hypothetical protein NNL22_00370 [Alkalimarinus sediminis]
MILDQNYQLLGFKRLYANQPLDQVEFEDLTGEIFVTDNGHKRLLGRIGEQLGDTSWGIVDRLVDSFPSLISIREHSDTSVRFEDTWGDEDKFTEPMKRYPAASLELLLNGLYPLKANFELMPVEKKLVGRSGRNKYELKGNRAKVTVDLPYFIEGESVLIVELKLSRSFFGQPKVGCPAIKYEGQETIEIKSTKLPDYSYEAGTGVYRNNQNAQSQVILVVDFDNESFSSDYKLDIGKKIEVECWVKVLVSGDNEQHSKTSIFLPWRGRSLWEDNSSGKSSEDGWLVYESNASFRN